MKNADDSPAVASRAVIRSRPSLSPENARSRNSLRSAEFNISAASKMAPSIFIEEDDVGSELMIKGVQGEGYITHTVSHKD